MAGSGTSPDGSRAGRSKRPVQPIDVTSSQAIVTYEWGDFKHDPIAVLAKYFDAHLYLTNWGTRHLAFRFRKGILDTKAIEVYCDKEYIRLKALGQVQILEIEINRKNRAGGG